VDYLKFTGLEVYFIDYGEEKRRDDWVFGDYWDK